MVAETQREILEASKDQQSEKQLLRKFIRAGSAKILEGKQSNKGAFLCSRVRFKFK